MLPSRPRTPGRPKAVAAILLALLALSGAAQAAGGGGGEVKYNGDTDNEPANNPAIPWGPTPVPVGKAREYCTSATDPDGDPIQYVFDWADGSVRTGTRSYRSGETGCDVHAWHSLGTYCIRAYAQDLISPVRDDWDDGGCLEVEVVEAYPNQAPGIPPAPTGPTTRAVNEMGTYCTRTTDPDGDTIQYVFIWDDDQQTMVQPAYGQEACASHFWTAAGKPCVEVYAQDLVSPVRGSSPCTHVEVGGSGGGSGAPYTPPPPIGPASLPAGTEGTFCATTSDPDGDSIQYVFDWDDGTSSTTPTMASGQQGCATHSWMAASPDPYCVEVYAQDLKTPVPGRSQCKSVTVTASTTSGNRPPSVPAPPSGPAALDPHEWGTYCTSSQDPDGDSVQIVFFWGDDTHVMSETGCAAHAWSSPGIYCIQAYAQDQKTPVAGWSGCAEVDVGAAASNGPPAVPAPPTTPDGRHEHRIGTLVRYCATTTDPDGDAIEYVFSWGDASATTTSARVASGQQGCADHAWTSVGQYCVRVYAQDLITPVAGQSGCSTETATGDVGSQDTDGDGIPDHVESAGWSIGVDAAWRHVASDPRDLDSDDDRLTDGQEQLAGTDPSDADTDGDGLADDLDHAHCLPARSDSDGDGILDGAEGALRTNCLASDTDGDHVPDGVEVGGWTVSRDLDGDRALESSVTATSDPLVVDTDADQLLDGEEWQGRTHPGQADTDGDGQSDSVELSTTRMPQSYDPPESAQASLALPPPPLPLGSPAPTSSGTEPADAPGRTCTFSNDHDCDGLAASDEQVRGTDPNQPDTDGDGVSDGAEVWMWRTDPTQADTDQDSVPDAVDLRPLVEDQHPLVVEVSSSDYYLGAKLRIRDQSEVWFLIDEMRFFDVTAGFECDEDFTRGARSVLVQGPSATPWGAPLRETLFEVFFVRQEHAYYSSDQNLCGPQFLAVLPFRDANGNTIQVELVGRDDRTCHTDPMKIAYLGLDLIGGPIANRRSSTQTILAFETVSFGFKTAQPSASDLPLYAYGVHGAYTEHKPNNFVGPRQGGTIGANVLRWIGPVQAGIGIATGDYVTCDSQTVVGKFNVQLLGEDSTVTDVQGRKVLMDIGAVEGRSHARAMELGDGWLGLGDMRANEDGADWKAWAEQTLKLPVYHYAVGSRYHVYCPADAGGGYVVTTEPRQGMDRTVFVTAYAAIADSGQQLPHLLRQCPDPAPILP